MADLSLRHLPDLSDASVSADFSDVSFQIPRVADSADDLLADETMDLLANDTLTTPAPPSRPPVQPPLTLADLTPRSKPARFSFRPRPGITTPYKATVASGLAVALSEDMSPLHHQDPSFRIPACSANDADLLLAEDGNNFLQEGPSLDSLPSRAHSPLTLSQLSPAQSRLMQLRPSASPSSPPLRPSHAQSPPSVANDSIQVQEEPGNNAPESHAIASPATHVMPTAAGPIQAAPADQSSLGPPAEKGIVKGPPSHPAERKKKLPGGDKAKRKKVASAAAITKSAKLNPSTISLARRMSLAGKTSVPGMRRRPLLAPSPAVSTGTRGRRVEGAARPTASAVRTTVKPARTGGLADTLLSFGQKLMASTADLDHKGAADMVTGIGNSAVPGEFVPAPIALDRHPGARPDVSREPQAILSPSYPVSPLRVGDHSAPSTTLASGSCSPAGAPTSLDQRPTEPQVAHLECPPSPMRRSIKRAGSPACDPPQQQRKRAKATSGQATPPSEESVPRKPTLQPSRSRNAPAAVASTAAPRARRVVSASASNANLRAKVKEAQKVDAVPPKLPSRNGPGKVGIGAKSKGSAKGEIPDGDSGAHADPSTSGGGKSRDASRSQKENLSDTKGRQASEHRDGQAFSAKTMRPASSVGGPSTNLFSAKPTRPVEFQFATSTRLEARKAELEKSTSVSSMSTSMSTSTSTNSHGMSLRRSKASATIPDFKALHALQESMLAQRRAEITPVVPLPIELSTEARSHERERYEEARRAREAELERQREERRRQQELEEEQEIKELRRRAVPKANEVPEWYAFAPKKSKAETGS
ncbi:hypothetical protein C2E23DRAFT_817962 [Lenzites betulinus]|nr:hypothetical protein C2E23DRAFT_817962 [Lenzites betulinus]